jgi:hypothetical protein
MRGGKVLVVLGSLVLGLALLGLAAEWQYLHWRLAKMALFGEAVGPIVGVLSLVAVVAGLRSVWIQRDALELQRKTMAKQQDSMNTQLDLQRKELEHQREALEAELRYRRHTALREVYVPFLTASSAYLDALREYQRKMDQPRSGPATGRRPCEEAHAELKRAYGAVLLVDASEERHEHRWPLSRQVRLAPWVLSPENGKDWAVVVLYRIVERSKHHRALRDSLQKEFGSTVESKSEDATKFDEEMLADLKAKADAIEERIGGELNEAARAEAIQNGWVPPDDASG